MKKIAIITTGIMGTLILTMLIGLVTLFFYIQSDHCGQFIQDQINQRIPGKMEWTKLNLLLMKGEVAIENYKLSNNGEEITSVEKLHISVDTSKFIKSFYISTLSRIFTSPSSSKAEKNPSYLKTLKQELIIKDITIDKPVVHLVTTPDKSLNVISAFPAAEQKNQIDENQPFRMPFNIVINNITLNSGKFQYKSGTKNINKSKDEDVHTPERARKSDNTDINKNDTLNILIDNIDLTCSGNIADRADLKFDLSMRSAGGDISLNGSVKNIILEPEYKALSEQSLKESEKSPHLLKKDSELLTKKSEPTIQLTANARLIMTELMKMVGTDTKAVSGKLSIHADIAGALNDPSLSCQILYPDDTNSKNTSSAAKSDKEDKKNLASISTDTIAQAIDSRAQIFGRVIKKVLLDVAMKKREVTVNSLEIEHPDARLKANGHISLAQAFPEGFIQGSSDIKKLTGKLHISGQNIDAGKLLDSENIKGIKGFCSLKTDISGSLDNPEISVILNAEKAGYLDYPVVDSAIFDLVFSRGVVNIKKIDLLSCNSAIKLGGTIKVLEKGNNGSFQPVPDPIFDIFANSDKINVTEILNQLKLLENQDIKASLAAKAKMSGTLKDPQVDLNVSGENILAAGQKIRSVLLKAGYKNHKSLIDSLVVTLASDINKNTDVFADKSSKNVKSSHYPISANILELKGWIDKNQKIKMDLLAKKIDLSLIEAVKNADVIKGVASFSIAAESSLNSLQSSKIKGDISLQHVYITGKPFEDFTAKVDFKDNTLNIKGKLNFDLDAGFNVKSKDFSLHGVFNKTDLTPWLAFADVKQIQQGDLTGTIDIKGNADHTDKISGSCDLRKVALNLFKDPAIFASDSISYSQKGSVKKNTLKQKDIWIRSENIKAWVDGKKFSVQKFRTILPENGELVLAASGMIGGGVRAEADATLPVKFASLFVQEMPVMKGKIKLNVKADIKPGADIKNSYLDANVDLIAIDVVLPDSTGGLKLHDINGTIKANANTIRIPKITGQLISATNKGVNSFKNSKASSKNQGEFILGGEAHLKNFIPDNIRAKLTARAIPVNMIEDLSAEFDTELNFKGNLDTSMLYGSVLVNRAQWTGDIHVEKQILSSLTEKNKIRKGIRQKETVSGFLENMKLNVAVKGKKPVIVDNNLAYLEIRPDIRIRGTAATPVVSGRSKINPGIINYQATEFTLTRGIIDFVNPYKIEPELDIESHRKVRDWDILLAVSGTPDNLNFKLTSEPKMEDGDIISLLLRGKTVTELINAEGGTTLSAASMLSQVAASAVSDKLKSATGLDIFEVGFGNNSGDNGIGDMNLTVGKELTDKITVKYGTENKDGIMVGKTSAEYKMMDNVSVSGFQDSEGQFGGEVRYRLEFR